MDLLEKKDFDTSRGLHYRYYVSPASQADNSKPAILLCHGWPDSADLWQYVVPHLLKSKNRLVIPDLLGAGGTSKPTDPASFEIKAMCQDVAEILDAEKIKQKIIPLGHDWGSFFASRFYMLHKPRTAGIILLNVAYMPPRSEPYNLEAVNAQTEKAFGNPLYAYWELFADPKVGEVMDPNLESVYYAIHGDEPEQMKNLFCTHGAIRKFISAGRKDVPLRPYAQDEKFKNSWLAEKKEAGMTSQNAWYRAMKENYHLATEKTLDAKITGPYLFIGCDGDAVCRQEFAQMAVQAGLVKEEQMTVKELHSGHWCPYEKPEEMAGIVLEWLKKEGFSG